MKDPKTPQLWSSPIGSTDRVPPDSAADCGSNTLPHSPIGEPHIVKRHVRLTVIQHPVFTPDLHGGTWKRSECPTARPCPRVFCLAHLYRVDASERAGRPSLGRAKRDSRGLIVSQRGDLGDEREGTLEPAWLETPIPDSCAWDVIERASGEPMGNSEVAVSLRRHRTLIAKVLKQAVEKLRAAGVTFDDLRLLMGTDDKPMSALARLIEQSNRRRSPNSPAKNDDTSSSECGVQHSEPRTP